MKLKIGTNRKFRNLIQNVNNNAVNDLFAEFGITEDTVEDQRYNIVLSKLDEDVKISLFRKLWVKMELLDLFSSWVSIYKTEKKNLTFTHFKSLAKNTKFKPTNYFTLNLTQKKSFKMFQLTYLSGSYKGLVDKAGTVDTVRDTIYWLPEEGILLVKFHDDNESHQFKSHVENNITGATEQFRIKSMIISKFYREMKIIKQLNVSAVFEITGFAGFDEISFKGDHVKQGLYGLHKRQDIRVNLDQIGPNIQAASENLHLKIGPQVMIKDLEGINELKQIISEF